MRKEEKKRKQNQATRRTANAQAIRVGGQRANNAGLAHAATEMPCGARRGGEQPIDGGPTAKTSDTARTDS